MRLLVAVFLAIFATGTLTACTDRSGSLGLLPNGFSPNRHITDNGGGPPGHSQMRPAPTPTP